MIFVGTSGWQYDDWRERFYPKSLPKARWLRFYSEAFPTVEINNTFYRLPAAATFSRWRQESADDFICTVKANRFITHIRRLREGREPVRLLWSRARRLGPKLGPVLFQLPPRFPADADRLRSFCAILPREMRAAFEFRDRSWETDEVYAILDRAGAALVSADSPRSAPPAVVTGGWAYVRFHKGGVVRPGYSAVKLRRWAERLAELEASDVFVYFNNDTGGAALRDATKLTSLLERLHVGVRGPGLAA